MSTVMVPANAGEALEMLECAAGFLADLEAADMPAEALAECLRGLERADAVQAAARGGFLAAFDTKDGPMGDGQRTTRTWLVHSTRVTRGQAAEHQAVQALAESHAPLRAGLREGWVITTSVGAAAGQVDAGHPGGVPRSRLRRSSSPRSGPGRACGSWPRSARRSATAPPLPTPTATMTGTWTGRCSWTPPSTAPGSCAAT